MSTNRVYPGFVALEWTPYESVSDIIDVASDAVREIVPMLALPAPQDIDRDGGTCD